MSTEQDSPSVPPASEVIFGQLVEDPYRWLEDPTADRVRDWVGEKDALARASLAAMPERAALVERLAELMYVSAYGLPARRGRRVFTSERKPTDEKFIHYVSDDGEAPKVLLDPHRMSSDGSLRVSGVSPSRDGLWVGYLEQPNSADESIIKVMRVDTKEVQTVDTISDVRHTGIGWDKPGHGFFYTWLPPAGSIPTAERMGYAEPRYHRLGTNPSNDVKVFSATHDASKFLGAFESFDGQYTVVVVHSGWDKTQVFVRRNDGTFASEREAYSELAPGKDAVFSATIHRDQLYFLTNLDAPRFRLLRTPVGQLAQEHWTELVAESEGVLESFDILDDRMVLHYSKNAHSEMELRDLDGKHPLPLALPTLGSVTGVSALPDSDVGYFAFSSFTHPTETFELDAKSGKIRHFVGGEAKVDVSQYQVDQQWYTSKDGTRVSMFVVHKRGLAKDGKNPTLLTGYGGFSSSMMPWYSPDLFAWLERGGVYAIPNLRGGGEYGEAWHQAGMRERKQNVFDDFIAAAEYLIENGYTQPKHLGIRGGSNGGLLVGAAMTQRPELFGAVVCSVPLLDMVRYHKFGLGRAWIPEYGDPDVEAEFRWLYAYSPYHQLRPDVHYPPLLMVSADTDDRVDPMHARKFVARLADIAKPVAGELLLWVERNAGHGGADLRRAQVERRADEYAFLWHHLASSR